MRVPGSTTADFYSPKWNQSLTWSSPRSGPATAAKTDLGWEINQPAVTCIDQSRLKACLPHLHTDLRGTWAETFTVKAIPFFVSLECTSGSQTAAMLPRFANCFFSNTVLYYISCFTEKFVN